MYLHSRGCASMNTSLCATAVCEIFQVLCNSLVPVTRCQTLFWGLMGSTGSDKSVDALAPSPGLKLVKPGSQCQETAESFLISHRLCLWRKLSHILISCYICEYLTKGLAYRHEVHKKRRGRKGKKGFQRRFWIKGTQ